MEEEKGKRDYRRNNKGNLPVLYIHSSCSCVLNIAWCRHREENHTAQLQLQQQQQQQPKKSIDRSIMLQQLWCTIIITARIYIIIFSPICLSSLVNDVVKAIKHLWFHNRNLENPSCLAFSFWLKFLKLHALPTFIYFFIFLSLCICAAVVKQTHGTRRERDNRSSVILCSRISGQATIIQITGYNNMEWLNI